jgi:transketolase
MFRNFFTFATAFSRERRADYIYTMKFTYTEKKDTRSGFGVGLHELGKKNENVVALCADLTGSLKMDAFKKEFPNRFFQVGIAEANMMGVAAGMTIGGKIPFTGTFANFSTGRVYDQIRQSIAYSHKNVKICASHAGVTLGEDGATHQILEDIGMMRMLPGMTVIVPCDYNQTRQATLALGDHHGPAYLRFGRPSWPIFTTPDRPFVIGKADHMIEGRDVTIFACGHLVWNAIEAEAELASRGISVELINIHTIKPLDVEAVLASVQKTKCVVTCEEHQANGGLGEAIAQVLARHYPAPLEMVAVNDSFGESGTPTQLLEKYGLSAGNITEAVLKVLKRKKS